MISNKYKESISEVLEILKNTKKEDVDKISPQFMEFLNKNKSKEYIPRLEHTKRIKDMQLNEMTIGLLSIIYSKFWCTQEQAKLFDNRLKENEQKYQEELRKKYDLNHIFKNRNDYQIKETENKVSIIEYKEKLLTKIINKIKKVFNWK